MTDRMTQKDGPMLGEREFTTEEIAQFCGVSRPAVVEWISRGLLPARLTEGGHRRVGRPALASFLKVQGYRMPLEVARERPLVFAIDDEAIWRQTIQSHLQPDFEVETFAQGADVLLACGARRPDVVVLDMRMPGMDGEQLLDALSKSTALAETLLVSLTAFEEQIAAARKGGAHLALSKTRASELHGLLVRLVSDAQRRQVLPTP